MDVTTVTMIAIFAACGGAIFGYTWKHIQDTKWLKDAYEELEYTQDALDDCKRQLRGLLIDNKRMLATLNHYQIRRLVDGGNHEKV